MAQRLALLALLGGSLFLTACTSSSIGSTAGAVSGIASSAATANPLVGYSIGVTVQAATDAIVKYVLSTWTQEQHDLMATIAGPLAVGQSQRWEVKRMIPYGNERGQLQVMREITNPLTHCKEIVFTVETDNSLPSTYMTAICKNNDQWQWASVEPAVQRWMGLH